LLELYLRKEILNRHAYIGLLKDIVLFGTHCQVPLGEDLDTIPTTSLNSKNSSTSIIVPILRAIPPPSSVLLMEDLPLSTQQLLILRALV